MLRLVTIAARKGAVGALEILLKHYESRETFLDEDILRPLFTSLTAASQTAQTSAVCYLVDLDPPWDIEEKHDYGNTPLRSDDKIRQTTLNAQDASGQTPLHLVVSFCYLPVLR